MCLAERTGLEPATPGVTGRYSNQLNYRSAAVKLFSWWALTESNRRHSACKADALPTELSARNCLLRDVLCSEVGIIEIFWSLPSPFFRTWQKDGNFSPEQLL